MGQLRSEPLLRDRVEREEEALYAQAESHSNELEEIAIPRETEYGKEVTRLSDIEPTDRIYFKEGELDSLLRRFREERGLTWNKLSEIYGIPNHIIEACVHRTENGKRSGMEWRYLSKILSKEELDLQDIRSSIQEVRPKGWQKRAGGLILKELGRGIHDREDVRVIEGLKRGVEQLRRYYETHYEEFREAADHKLQTLRGDVVRNPLEKAVADALHQRGIDYEYELFLKAEGHNYFPDFKAGNLIIECTSLKEKEKAKELIEKAKNYSAAGYTPTCVIHSKAISYYNELKKSTIVFTEKQMSELCSFIKSKIKR